MKRFITLSAAVLLLGVATAFAWNPFFPGFKQTITNEPGLTYNNTYQSADLNAENVSSLSMQTIQSSVTYAASTFTDGTASTASITVVSTQPLVGMQGTDLLTVSTNALPSNAKFTINGYEFINGGDWAIGASSSATAISMANGINSHSAYLGVTASTTSINVVTVKCSAYGALCNTNTMTVNNSSMTVSANFSGGVDHAQICINGTCLVEGTDWNVLSSSTAATAVNISTAIAANATLSTIVTSTCPANKTSAVIASTSTGVGTSTNYGMFCKPASALTCSGTGSNNQSYVGGTNSAITTSASMITSNAHGFMLALPVLYTKTAGTSPGLLVVGTTYYVTNQTTNNFQLASTSAKAQAGTNDVAITTQTATGGGTFVLTPLAISGTPSWKWQYSNDGANWSDLTTTSGGVAVSSVTFISPYTAATNNWDLGGINFQYIRLNVIGPTQGGVKLKALLTGRHS